MLAVVLIFLGASIALYLLMGGADFGAGIVELFSGKNTEDSTRKLMYQSMAPVWEANHMWLIIFIVILFVGFPDIYTTMSIYDHIPLVLMLIGIIARGTAFTFRHYDVVHDDWQKIYKKIFLYSSLLTPVFFGMLAGSMVSGSMDNKATDFLSAYIFSWVSFFNFSVGVFNVTICGYLASVYSIQETDDPILHKMMKRKAVRWMIAVVLGGGLVFIASLIDKVPLFTWLFDNPIGIAAVILASISILWMFYCFRTHKIFLLRYLAGFQVMMILIAATYYHFPNFIVFKDGSVLSLLSNHADMNSIVVLGWALILGSLFILPFLFYLLYSFSRKRSKLL